MHHAAAWNGLDSQLADFAAQVIMMVPSPKASNVKWASSVVKHSFRIGAAVGQLLSHIPASSGMSFHAGTTCEGC